MPDGWEWCRLNNFTTFIGGYAYKSSLYVKNSNNLVIRIGNIKNNFFNPLITKTCISNEYAQETQGYKIRENDILFTMTGTKGKRDYFYSYLVQKKDLTNHLFLNQRVGCLRTINKSINVHYMLLVLQSSFILNSIFLTETGSANQGNISSIATMNLLIPLPPSQEQNKIVTTIENCNNNIVALEDELKNVDIIISTIKSKILDLAIRGKLVPQNPNDEPASLLLERIREEKEELIKQGKIKRDKRESIIFKGEDNSYYEKYGEKLPNGWVVTNFETLLSYEQPAKYIVKNTNYKNEYKTPVLTAGKSFILGYTNEENNIFTDLPVIIFDDFTTENKFVDFPFKVKSSAMKILHINTDLVLPKYAFYLMQTTEIDHENHQRYWISIFSQETIALPPINEQERILAKLEYYFNLLEML